MFDSLNVDHDIYKYIFVISLMLKFSHASLQACFNCMGGMACSIFQCRFNCIFNFNCLSIWIILMVIDQSWSLLEKVENSNHSWSSNKRCGLTWRPLILITISEICTICDFINVFPLKFWALCLKMMVACRKG